MNENTMNNDVTMAGRASVLAGRYRIIRQLGQGGMGSVWLAEDMQLDNKLFAIKLLPSILVANKRAYNQLKVEALVAMKLVHPNIVQIRAFEENNGNPFLVMDYIHGKSLDRCLVDWGNLNSNEVSSFLKPIAEAIDYAHSKGVVHRDVKPSNIIVAEDLTPYILDFGIAREIQETMTFVTGKMSSGTLMYMSPEQLHGHTPKKFQDIYSFAAMVYECLTGRPPFCRGQIEYQIDHDDPEPLPKDISIASSVMAGLAKKPEERPKNCVAVLEGDCKKKEEHRGIDRPPEPCGKPFGKIAAIGFLTFGLIGGIWYWQDLRAKEEAQILAEQKAAEAKRKAAEEVRLLAEKANTEEERRAVQKAEAEQKAAEVDRARIAKIAENTHLAIQAFEAKRWVEGVQLSINANLNDKTIQFYLGRCYAKGEGVVKDDAEAVKWYRKAAEQGCMKAQNNLGLKYVIGDGVAKDVYEAVKWFRKAAEQGNADAQFNLGVTYADGEGVAKDDTEAIKWFLKAAEQGNAYAQNNLGLMYQDGRGVAKDNVMAIKWYRKSAEQGNATAQNNLGIMYEYGDGVVKDDVEAVKWYRKAAEQGLAQAQSNLGLMYKNGRGVIKDNVMALKWCRKAAEQGNATAQSNLGLMYKNGLGVTKDEAEAVKWYRKAAEQGNESAQISLGWMYENGFGVKKDYVEAVKWYRKAAEQGHAAAQFLLGGMYEDGYGVEKDEFEAVKWYRKAAEQGNAKAESALKRLGQ